MMRATIFVALLAVVAAESHQGYSFSLDSLDHSDHEEFVPSEELHEKFCNDPVCFNHEDTAESLFLETDDVDDNFEILLEVPGAVPVPGAVAPGKVVDAISAMNQDMSAIPVDQLSGKKKKASSSDSHVPTVSMRLVDNGAFNVNAFRASLAAYLGVENMELKVTARNEAGTIVAIVNFVNTTERALVTAQNVIAKFNADKAGFAVAVKTEVVDVAMTFQGPNANPPIWDHAGKTEGGLFGDFKIKVFKEPDHGAEHLLADANKNFSTMFKCETVCAPPPPSAKQAAFLEVEQTFAKDVCEMRGGKWEGGSCAPFLQLTSKSEHQDVDRCNAEFGQGYSACSAVQALALASVHQVPQGEFYWVANDAGSASSARLLSTVAVDCLDGTFAAYEHKFGSSAAACVSAKRELPTMCCHDNK